MKTLFLVLMSLFTAVGAFAEPFCISNIYVDAFGGLNIVNSFDEDDIRVDLNSGYVVGGALGYRFSRFFRFEGEVAYRKNTFHQMIIQDLNFPASGNIQKVTLMANGILELPLQRTVLIPYCGIGLGERWDRETFTLKPVDTTEGTLVFDTLSGRSHGFVYQVIVGITFYPGQKFQLAAEYRYLDGCNIQGNNTIDLNVRTYF